MVHHYICSLSLSFWSYVVCACTEPGLVPVFWALYSTDGNERKYCLKCHNFKPERCHHCSRCCKCVMNMDHHCPWVNNCVGFHILKSFLLFVLYLTLAMASALVPVVLILIREITGISRGERNFSIHTVVRCGWFLLVFVVFIMLVAFLCMHISMVVSNTTTLESMIEDRKAKEHPELGERPN